MTNIMSRSHFVLLFVSCLLVMIFIDVQDLTSLIELLTLHPMDYLIVLIGAAAFYVLLLPFMVVSHKFLFAPKKIRAAGKSTSLPRI